jgi:hypothetical protein
MDDDMRREIFPMWDELTWQQRRDFAYHAMQKVGREKEYAEELIEKLSESEGLPAEFERARIKVWDIFYHLTRLCEAYIKGDQREIEKTIARNNKKEKEEQKMPKGKKAAKKEKKEKAPKAISWEGKITRKKKILLYGWLKQFAATVSGAEKKEVEAALDNIKQRWKLKV